MAKIKSYTDLEQSKKLEEILPLESADMYYSAVPVREWKDKEDTSKGTHVVFKDQIFALENLPNGQIGEGDTFAWSLSALLGVLPNENMLVKTTDGEYYCLAKDVMTKHYDNPIDACYELVLKLYELKML